MNRVPDFAVENEFTNNILTVMRALNSRGERKLLEAVISDYSALLHYLQRAPDELISSALEFEACECFLRLQHIRYGKRLCYSLSKSEQPSVLSVKKFSVLSAVADAVDYIAEHPIEGGFIRVDFSDVIKVLLQN